jgi:hypothetical protein
MHAPWTTKSKNCSRCDDNETRMQRKKCSTARMHGPWAMKSKNRSRCNDNETRMRPKKFFTAR